MQLKGILTMTNFSSIESTNPSYFIHTKWWKLIKPESKTKAGSEYQTRDWNLNLNKLEFTTVI